MLDRMFVRHLDEVNENYFEHLRAALAFSGTMFLGSLACLLHALIPGLCVKTGSKIVGRLHDRMVVNRVARKHL